MNIKKKLMNNISESLNFIDDLDDDFSLSKKSVSQAVKDNSNFKTYYSNKLQLMLPIPDEIDREFIEQAIKLHEKYGALYNPHLNGEKLHDFILACIDETYANVNLNWIDTSEVTNMDYLFCNKDYYGGDVNYIETYFNGDVSQWDVSNVKSMQGTFYKCKRFTGDISSWDVSHVTNMSYMFAFCSNMNLDFSKWDVSHVINMENMFAYCQNFDGDGLEKWDVSNVETTSAMFIDCNNFNGDLSHWNTSKVYDISSMFCYCYSFNSDISHWDVSHVVNMLSAFLHCISFNLDLSSWDVHIVRTMYSMFNSCKKFNLDLSSWNVFYQCDTRMMFNNCNSLENLPYWYKLV